MNNRNFNSVKFILACILLVLVVPLSSSAEEGIASLNISMTWYNQKEGSSKSVEKNIELTTEAVSLKKGDRIEDILSSKGILPDGESFEIVYRINPNIDGNILNENATLIVPAIRKMRGVPEVSKKSYMLALTLDKEMKKYLLDILKSLDYSAAMISSVQVEQFASSAEKEKFTQIIKAIAEKMGAFGTVVRERTRPLSSEMLVQMHDEAKQVNSILAGIIKHKEKVSKSDVETINLVGKNMDIRIRTLNEEKGFGEPPSRWPEVRVFVRTMDIKKGEETHNLRVYYVPQALWNCRKDFARSFDRLTSPSDRNLPEADYFIWAAKAADSVPLTEIRPVEVRISTPNEKKEFDLIVK